MLGGGCPDRWMVEREKATSVDQEFPSTVIVGRSNWQSQWARPGPTRSAASCESIPK